MNLYRRIFLFVAIICASCPQLSTANSAMAIDLGSEFMKMALIKPGVPMETVLNRESQRKTPMALTIKDGERFLGETARKKALSMAQHTFAFFLDLVGKQMDDPIVTAFQAQFPFLTLKAHPQRGTVQFGTDAGDVSVECALGMVLWNARQEVEAYAGQPVRDAVVTRAAVEAAAKIADVNLLQLLSSGTAAGLNYGVFRHKEITEQPQRLLIYDVGSTKTLVTIVQLRLVNETATPTTTNGKNATKSSSNKAASGSFPQVETIGVGYNRTLGGYHLTLRLRDHLVKAFKQQYPKLEGDVTQNAKAMAKLLKEADRVKQVLSANSQHFAHVESVFEDLDFRTKVTREELEALFHDFESCYLEPISDALRMAGLTVEQLDRVLLMGAGTRVPRLKTILSTFFQGKELSKQLNTDEAIVLGAVYQAARLIKGFRVKPFEVKELFLPHEVDVSADPPSFTKWLSSLTVDDAQLQHNMSTVIGDDEIKEAKKILSTFERNEKAKMEHALALNSLESAVYDYTAKLEEDSFSGFGTEEELQLVRQKLKEMKDWLEDMPSETSVEELKQKRREVVAPIRKLKSRKRQKEDRPAVMEKLTTTLDEAEKKLQLFTTSKEFFTEGELTSYQQTIETVKVWFDGVKKELEQLKDNQDATFTTDNFKTKTNSLIGEVRFLASKYYAAALKLREEAEAEARKAKLEAEAEAKKAEAEAKEVTKDDDKAEAAAKKDEEEDNKKEADEGKKGEEEGDKKEAEAADKKEADEGKKGDEEAQTEKKEEGKEDKKESEADQKESEEGIKIEL
uniref:Hypoxia up-regulated protein 1 n=1 Tax=Globodera pallida TaxID=36090 RepID=A0A183C132_GLOPA